LALSIGIVSLLLGGLLALNGYLAIRNYAFTFFGPGASAAESVDADHHASAIAAGQPDDPGRSTWPVAGSPAPVPFNLAPRTDRPRRVSDDHR
jgi:hypothetical protein